jgi:hypothetical protein
MLRSQSANPSLPVGAPFFHHHKVYTEFGSPSQEPLNTPNVIGRYQALVKISKINDKYINLATIKWVKT